MTAHLPLARRLLTLAALATFAAPAQAVEPLHRIHEPPRGAAKAGMEVALPSGAAVDLGTEARAWFDVLARWLRTKRGPVQWTGEQGLSVPADAEADATVRDRQLQLSQLRAGDRLVIAFESVSCFSHVSGELRYDVASGAWQVFDAGHNAVVSKISPLDHLPPRQCAASSLAAADLPRIDALLHAWRAGEGEICSNHLKVTVTWMRGDKQLSSEEFADVGCGVPQGGIDLLGIFTAACGTGL